MHITKVAAASVTVLLASVLASPLLAQALNTKTDKTSYAMGLETGIALKRHDAQVNADLFAQGLKDGLSGAKPLMSQEEVEQTLKAFQEENLSKLKAQYDELAAKNEKASAAFLAENKGKPGVQTLFSGLQYKILTPGSGPKPKVTDKVEVDYEGQLIDGKVFDSSYKRGKPAEFPVNGVIKGWSEGLQLMQPGATWMFYIPADLAYGQQGVPGAIGPNAALVFKVHLIKIQS